MNELVVVAKSDKIWNLKIQNNWQPSVIKFEFKNQIFQCSRVCLEIAISKFVLLILITRNIHFNIFKAFKSVKTRFENGFLSFNKCFSIIAHKSVKIRFNLKKNAYHKFHTAKSVRINFNYWKNVIKAFNNFIQPSLSNCILIIGKEFQAWFVKTNFDSWINCKSCEREEHSMWKWIYFLNAFSEFR